MRFSWINRAAGCACFLAAASLAFAQQPPPAGHGASLPLPHPSTSQFENSRQSGKRATPGQSSGSGASPAPQIAPPPAEPKPDPVEVLLAATEKEYELGREHYNSGRLPEAREHFNRALDLLLMSPIEIKSDDRLQQEFDRIVEGVHEFELAALQENEGLAEQRSEPAPIDEANEATFPVDPNIKAQAEQELKNMASDLPLTLNDAVASYINYFSNGRGRSFLEHGYERAGLYRDMILRTLQSEGVPRDLIYLAQAESGFHPLALSRAGARGMWQFMADRGLEYGLRRNAWVDERQDPLKATRAAAQHLKDLYDQFGDWYLAMAAYNSGPGTVQHAVERTGYADYWELYRRGVLPAETRNYVPIILAITIMSKNPKQYGLEHMGTERPQPSEVITIHYAVDLRLVADCAETSVAVLQELNPSLLHLTTPKDDSFDLHLPQGSKDKYQQAIAAIPLDKRLWWRYPRVSPGETLAEIAQRYHSSVSLIESANHLEGGELRTNARLVVPVAPGRERQALVFSKRAIPYVVRRGDTVSSVAESFEVPVESLRRWNHLKGEALTPGRVLLIHRPVAAAAGVPKNRSARPHAHTQAAHRNS